MFIRVSKEKFSCQSLYLNWDVGLLNRKINGKIYFIDSISMLLAFKLFTINAKSYLIIHTDSLVSLKFAIIPAIVAIKPDVLNREPYLFLGYGPSTESNLSRSKGK